MESTNFINMNNEETNELKNDVFVLKERNVTISLARYEDLIRAEQKLILLCGSIYESNDYDARKYRLIAGEKLLPLTEREIEHRKEEKARQQKKGE